MIDRTSPDVPRRGQRSDRACITLPLQTDRNSGSVASSRHSAAADLTAAAAQRTMTLDTGGTMRSLGWIGIGAVCGVASSCGGGTNLAGDGGNLEADAADTSDTPLDGPHEVENGDEGAGEVEACVPNCAGRECGDDGCGGTCAPGCSAAEMCQEPIGTCGRRHGWLQVGPTSPAAREWASSSPELAYDSARGVLVLVETDPGNGHTSTWERHGTSWVRSAARPAPPARAASAIAYDSARDVLVLFGGEDYPGCRAETWEYDGRTWTQISTRSSPPARCGHAMAYDSARHVVVLFGGQSDAVSGLQLGDTWEYDGSTWTQVATPTSPAPRSGQDMVYDSTRGIVVLFGGTAGATFFDDTWEYDGTTWTRVSTPTAPEQRAWHAMAYDAARGVVVLFGGFDTATLADAGTWEYDGTTWTQATPLTSPPARSVDSMAYDPARSVVVLFGGYG